MDKIVTEKWGTRVEERELEVVGGQDSDREVGNKTRREGTGSSWLTR